MDARRMTTFGRTAAVAGLALTTGLLLSACDGSGADQAANPMDTAAGDATSPTSIDPSRVSPTDLPTVPRVAKAEGAIADAQFGDCDAAEGHREVTGSVHNSGTSVTDYVVTVSWTNPTSDVLARSVVVVEDLATGAKKDFTAKADVPAGATTCTFNVVRGALR